MAEKRMFAKSIVLTDEFLDMPMSARCLYFTLGMLADDDGFVGSPKSIMRQCGASQDDMRILLSKRYLLCFDSGVVVIKHWLINNYLRKDRYTPTIYKKELETLNVEETGTYTEKALPTSRDTTGIPGGVPGGIPRIDQSRLEENRVGKSREDKSREEEGANAPKKKSVDVFAEFAGDDEPLLSALRDFAEFRRKAKKPMTDNAKRRLLTKLQNDFKPGQWVDVINQSVDRGWTDIYPLKEDESKKTNNIFLQILESENESTGNW